MGIDLTNLEMMRKAALLVDENYGNSNKKLEKGIETLKANGTLEAGDVVVLSGGAQTFVDTKCEKKIIGGIVRV